MRYLASLFLLALLARPLPGQTPSRRWEVHLGASHEAFRGASIDSSTIPGEDVEVFPASRVAVHGGVARRFGNWELGLELGYSAGALRARTDLVVLDDRSGDVTRYRAALLGGRRVARLGPASLTLLAGGALDHWDTNGIGRRSTVALLGGLALRVPLGSALEFENRVLGAIAAGPFRKQDLPPEARIRSLRTLSIGVGLRIGL